MKNRNIVLNEIGRGFEGIFLERLKTYSYKDFSIEFQNLVFFLLILMEKGNVKEDAREFFRKTLFAYLESNQDTKSFQEILDFIVVKAETPFENISSFLGRLIIMCLERTHNSDVNLPSSIEQGGLLEATTKILAKCMDASDSKITDVMTVLYNCIVDMEFHERRIILSPKATKIFRENYLNVGNNFEQYLRYFIRPFLYGPDKSHKEYWLHVPEPFYVQIFGSDEEFRSLLASEIGKDIDQDLLSDIIRFLDEYAESELRGREAVAIKSKVKLISDLHALVRK